jgi:hypothetical protein
MISNLIIIVSAPFGEREYKRYGIDVIKRNNLNVFVWNLSPILYPDVHKNMQLPYPIKWENLIDIHDIDQFIQELRNFKANNSFIYTTILFNLSTFNVYKAISKSKIPYCVTSLNSQPSFGSEYLGTLANRLLNITPKKILSKFISQIPFKILGLRHASMVEVMTNKSRFKRPDVSKTTRIIYTHSSDYDRYTEANFRNEVIPKYIVYLDNFLPFHPDSLYTEEVNPVTADLYHESLNKFFEELELITSVKVIIAAHPKSNYSELFNPFNGRKIVWGKTVELVRNSEIVVLNFSTSINFAILYCKAVVFFTTNELQNVSLYRKHIEGMASLFEKKAFNIDKKIGIDKIELYKVNYKLYNEYKNSYIKTNGTHELHSWQIKCNEIKQFMNRD